MQSIVKKVVVMLVPFLFISCGDGSRRRAPDRDTYESCLAQEKLFIAGSCYDGAGLKGADLRTLLFGHTPFLESLHKDHLEICILTEPRFHGIRLKLEKEIRKAVFSWIEPLKTVSHSMPRSIGFVYPDFSRSEPDDGSATQKCPATRDATIFYLGNLSGTVYGDEDRAFANSEGKVIWLSHDSLRPGTILHEFGHIFGLADIYIEDAWTCRKDFPNSIMCQSEWNSVMPTDKVAVQRNYCLFTDGEHPNCFNHEKKELLSFLPKRRRSPIFDHSFRDPYLTCENEKSRFSFQPFSFLLGPKFLSHEPGETYFLGLYASDPSAIDEVYGKESFQTTFSVENMSELPKDRQTIPLLMELRGEQLHVQFPVGDQQRQESFSSCYVDARLVEYFKKKGVNFPDSLLSHQKFHLLKSQPTRIDLEDEIDPKGTLKIYLEKSPPKGTLEILIFQRESHDLIKALPFDDVAQIQEGHTIGYVFNVAVEKLQLTAGSYEIFIVADDYVYHNVMFSIAN
ncbi:hypothetical protein [Oligoflexus tunisiensis]|uniref:hypothetical protein n=1 Tax=Oligoflexus tunisiensis TaxID=708132 RepID=UPI00114D055F|nr:hypothetical protein [Oligoflexus tunisiensis]